MRRIFGLLFTFIVIGSITSCPSERSYSIEIQNKEDVVFEDATLKVRLYGQDRNVQDNSATVISEIILDIETIPSLLTLEWPEHDYQLIDQPPVIAPDDATYYLHVFIDSNKDGVLCLGDYRRDYDMTPIQYMAEKPVETITIFVTSIDSDSCREF